MSEHKKISTDTNWEPVSHWYSDLVGSKGHYYHREIVLPNLLKSIHLKKKSSLVDLACGQGVLSRAIPPIDQYLGIDGSSSLIKYAKQHNSNPKHSFQCSDLMKKLSISQQFSHATLILALQNMKNPEKLIANASSLLKPQGRFFIVLNHPCFRIPRQSRWQEDLAMKVQFRRLDRYSSPLKIPIHMHPSQGKQSTVTYSFHFPLETYVHMLVKHKLVVCDIQEWYSNKKSQGSKAKMENRARQEFPLFLMITAIKISDNFL